MSDLRSKTAVQSHKWGHVISEFEIPDINFHSIIAESALDVQMPQKPSYDLFTGPFANEVNIGSRKMLTTYRTADLFSLHDQFKRLLVGVVRSFSSLLSDYDKKVILPATCALSIKKSSHFDIDETGKLGRGKVASYPDVAFQCINRVYSDLLRSIQLDEAHLSLPRGKNLGWPTPVSTRSRADSDLLLGVHTLVSVVGKKKGYRLIDLYKDLEGTFGPSFAYSGYRLQHHGKVHLCCCADRNVITECFEPRSRAIYMSPKFAVAWNRPYVKALLGAVMKNPLHTQDRTQITQRISAMLSSGYTIALDVGKFDQSHGGTAGEQIIKIMCDLLSKRYGMSADHLVSDFMAEFDTMPLIRSLSGCYRAPGGQILSSGVSMTSVLGCFGSELIAYTLASILLKTSDPDAILSQKGRSWDALTWGDDIVFSVSKRFFSDYEAFMNFITKGGETVNLEFTAEPTIKFLGQNYDMLEYQGSKSYPLSRMIQNSFFPERPKLYPYTQVGYIARLLLLDPHIVKDVHKVCLSYQDTLGIRPFDWADHENVLREMIPLIQKRSDSIGALDDVLNIFSHGLDPDMFDGSFESDAMMDMLALTRVDVSDPMKFLSENLTEDKYKDGYMDYYLKNIQEGKFTSILDLCDHYHIGRIHKSGTVVF